MKKLVGTILMVCIATLGYSQGAAGLAKQAGKEVTAKILGVGATSAAPGSMGRAANKATATIALENEVLNGTRGGAHSKIHGAAFDKIDAALELQVLNVYKEQLKAVKTTPHAVPKIQGPAFTQEQRKQLQSFVRGAQVKDGYMAADYAAFIPAEANILYLGKGGTAQTREQILRLMTQYRKQYPGRSLYLAVESIYAEAPFAADAQQLDQAFGFLHGYTEQELMIKTAVHELGMKIVGLESLALFNKKVMEFRFHQAEYWKWASSPQGLKERNQYWADQINKVFEQDPQAVVFVLGSKQNLMLNQPHAVPKLVKGQKPFTIMFSSPAVQIGNVPHYHSLVSLYWHTLMGKIGPQNTPLRFAVFKDRKQANAFGGQMMVEVLAEGN